MDNEQIIRDSIQELNRLKAQKMTNAQLLANIGTYSETGPNAAWRQVCVQEHESRQ